MRIVFFGCAVAGLMITAAASADDNTEPASVLVRSEMPHKGTLDNTLTAYGTAAPATDGSMTISVQHEGRVLQLAVTSGESVAKGQRLLDFAASSVTISNYQQAASALNLARSEHAHTAQLFAQKLATRDQLAQAEKAVKDAQAALTALQSDGSGNSVQVVKAPFDGIVTAIPVTLGDRVQPGAPLINLMSKEGLVVTVGIEATDRNRVKPGQEVDLYTMPGDSGKISGKVVRIDDMINPKTRLIDIDITAAGNLIYGQSYRTAIKTGQAEGWIVPRSSVLKDDKGYYVFQTTGEKAARVDAELSLMAGDTAVIEGNIDPQKPLVIDGNYQLSDGMAVRQGKPGT